MRLFDQGAMALAAIVRYPLRSSMLLVAIAIGVSAVLVLTSLGEGARLYVTGQFNTMGAHLVFVMPGKTEIGGMGGFAGSMSGSVRPLTVDDLKALRRSPHIKTVTAFVPGIGIINYRGVERNIDVLGTTSNMQMMFDYEIERGRFLPELELDDASPVGVIGHTIAEELFRNTNPVGQWARIGDRRIRIIGVMANAGMAGGIDVDEALFVPVGFAMQMFNRDSVPRAVIEAVSLDEVDRARQDIREIVMARHSGNDDITVMEPGAILNTFNRIFLVLTTVLAGIAAISLTVAGTLIMNVMLVAVSQRTEEIGLLKALGAQRRQIVGLFLMEAALLSVLGAIVGYFVGQGAIELLRELYPIVDFRAPNWAIIAALVMAVGSGLLFGIMPARRAARLDPVQALAGH
jgi:putative ABC transport system permease protein